MSSDRELLELAAKAAGMEFRWDQPRGAKSGTARARLPSDGPAFPVWSPLTDYGDALRLAVNLGLVVDIGMNSVVVWKRRAEEFVEVDDFQDMASATRRAIVRAAAELGKAKQ